MNPELKAEFGRGILAAWLTAKGDPKGGLLVSGTFAECKRSFFAALVALPGAMALLAFKMEAMDNIDTVHYVLADLVSYAIGWAAYPLVALGVARQIGLEIMWARYITVYNWASVLVLALTIPVTLLVNTPVLPEGVGSFLGFATLIAIILYEWRLARLVLLASPMQAAFLTILDMLLSFFVDSLGHQIGMGSGF